jgi:AcrR family transcriptional regulator
MGCNGPSAAWRVRHRRNPAPIPSACLHVLATIAGNGRPAGAPRAGRDGPGRRGPAHHRDGAPACPHDKAAPDAGCPCKHPSHFAGTPEILGPGRAMFRPRDRACPLLTGNNHRPNPLPRSGLKSYRAPMNAIPARLLRPQADACRSRPPLSERDRERRDYILEAARNVFIRHGRANVTVTQFCYAARLAPVTLRRQFSDMDHLFGLVLQKHLDSITTAIGQVPKDVPDIFAARRAAYFQATRGICDVPTPLHFLLLRDRFHLPPDELDAIEFHRRVIGALLGPGEPENTLALLDAPTLDLGQIEAMHAALTGLARARAEAPPPEPDIPVPALRAPRLAAPAGSARQPPRPAPAGPGPGPDSDPGPDPGPDPSTDPDPGTGTGTGTNPGTGRATNPASGAGPGRAPLGEPKPADPAPPRPLRDATPPRSLRDATPPRPLRDPTPPRSLRDPTPPRSLRDPTPPRSLRDPGRPAKPPPWPAAPACAARQPQPPFTRAPQPGAPQPGAPQPGAPQPGVPQPGAPQPGMSQPRAPQPVAPPRTPASTPH